MCIRQLACIKPPPFVFLSFILMLQNENQEEKMKNELTKGINKRTEKKAELIASTIEKVVIGAAAIMWLVIMATSPAYAKDSGVSV